MAENVTAHCTDNYLKVSNTKTGDKYIFDIEDAETMKLVDEPDDYDLDREEEIPVFHISEDHLQEIQEILDRDDVEVVENTGDNAEKIDELCFGENGSGMSVVATILLTTTMGVFGAMGLVLLIALMVAPPDGPSSRQLRRYNYY